jgi:thiol-disulfide isomerase/thioredoxin
MQAGDAPRPASPIDDETAASVVPPPPVAASAADPDGPEVKQVDFAELDRDFAAAHGKLLVVDFWATWCTACRDKFPQFVQLAERYKGRDDVLFATVANDEADRIDEVRDFLRQARLAARHFLLDEDPNDFAAKFGGGLPMYHVYAPDGELLFRSNNVEELAAKLEEAVPPKS